MKNKITITIKKVKLKKHWSQALPSLITCPVDYCLAQLALLLSFSLTNKPDMMMMTYMPWDSDPKVGDISMAVPCRKPSLVSPICYPQFGGNADISALEI